LRRLVPMVALALGIAMITASCGSNTTGAGAGTPTLAWYIFPEPSGSFAAAASECSKASNGEYNIQMHILPAAADGQRQEMVRRLAAGDTALDILGLDVTWTAEFAEAGWLAPWPDQLASQVRSGTLPTMIRTGTWKNKLYSAPFNTNTQVLWYRKSLVPNPPKTWAEMLDQAKKLAAAGKPHYIEIQGAQYEGFTVWFNTMVASAGGSIVSPSGKKVTLGSPALKALQIMADLAHSPAADPSLSNQMEDQNRLAFESGVAAFELNYPFVYPSAKADVPKIYKDMGWAPYPTVDPSQPSHVTIGGIDLAVSSLSRYKKQSFDAIQCLRQDKNQARNAVKGGLPPVSEAVYKDKSFQKAYPAWKTILQSLQNASVRPLTPAYQSVSLQIAYSLSPPSTIVPSSDLPILKTRIQDAIDSRGLVP
jgi:multiple sugar transport system substrate-binding protein